KAKLLLLVRLKTEHKRISLYESRGYTQEAKELREEVAQENAETIRAFRTQYFVSDLLFFYDTSSSSLAEGKLSGHLFTDEGKYTDSLIRDTSEILIAEFGSPHSEAFGSSSGFGLVVYDAHFEQMKEPFPFYTSNYFGLISRQEVVAKFAKRLKSYLSSD